MVWWARVAPSVLLALVWLCIPNSWVIAQEPGPTALPIDSVEGPAGCYSAGSAEPESYPAVAAYNSYRLCVLAVEASYTPTPSPTPLATATATPVPATMMPSGCWGFGTPTPNVLPESVSDLEVRNGARACEAAALARAEGTGTANGMAVLIGISLATLIVATVGRMLGR